PEIVVEVGFTEWTADGMLRHPKYLGLRDDIHPANVRRETTAQSTRKRREVEPWPNASGATGRLIATLAEVEARGGEAVVDLSGGGAPAVGQLDEVCWPGLGLPEGARLRDDAWAAPRVVPAVADRPVVMRRF